MRRLLRGAPPLLLVAVAGVLLFWRLGANYLWQDEAMTAVLGERLMTHGRPLAYDGRNIITYDSFVDEDLATIRERASDAGAALRHLIARGDFKPDTTWVAHPWGQFVVAGLSLSLLGHGTAAARAPFALAALLTIILLYTVVRRTFADAALAFVAATLLTANAFWILHGRQCRYYALSSFALLATVAAFSRWQRGGRWGAPLFVAVAWLYFHCDYGSFFPTLAVLGIVATARAWPRPVRVLVTFAAIAGGIAPFVWYHALFARIRNTAFPWTVKLAGTVSNVNMYLVPLPLLAAAAWLIWRRRRDLAPPARTMLLCCVGVIASLLVWVPAVAAAPFHRYVAQATPLAAVVTAWLLVEVARALSERFQAPWFRGAVMAGLTAFVTLSALASAPVAWALPEDWTPARVLLRPELDVARREIFSWRPDPNREVVAWLAPRLRAGDEILVNYEDCPLMFYTGARIRGGVAAFRAQERGAPPPRFLVLRRSVDFVYWPVFEEEVARYRWRVFRTGAPDVPFGNNPDPTALPLPAADEVVVAERIAP